MPFSPVETAIHFKGFDKLLVGRPNPDKLVDDVATNFVGIIKSQVTKHSLVKLVWDGDDFHETQWTKIIISVLQQIKDLYHVSLLTCKEIGGWGASSPEAYLEQLKDKSAFGILLDEVPLTLHTYGKESSNRLIINGSSPKDYTTVGMYLLYKTSHLANKVLILCAGGGATVLREYEYTKKNYENFKDDMIENVKPIELSVSQKVKFHWYLTTVAEAHYRCLPDKPIEHSALLSGECGDVELFK